MLGPRLVVAGTRSGAGKTTVATGLMAALVARGHRVASAKVGPDFIDPSYHAAATGRPGRNLDPWLCGGDGRRLAALAGRAADGAGILVVEGVMGLFDGAADGTPSSTADVARTLDAPVVLVVDCASAAQSVAAVVHGFATFDPTIRVAGVICNQVASDSHEAMIRTALSPLGIPVLGVLRRGAVAPWRSRHLGLVPAAEAPGTVAASLRPLASAVAAAVDLEAVVAIAEGAGRLPVDPVELPEPTAATVRPRVAVAAGPAFSFTYTDNLEALAAAGAEVVAFDPLTDTALPEATAALVAGGGFPELHAAELSGNRPMLDAVRAFDGPVWAECGGLAWLARSLDGHPMAGVVPADARLGERGVLGYRHATTTAATPLGPAGTALRGHEWHYTTCDPDGAALRLEGRHGTSHGGFSDERLLASYLHVHLGATPGPATAFVAAAALAAAGAAR